MKTVLFSSHERVDLPDLQAISGLVESEFRRQLSQAILGLDVNVVLRGFEVEPESPATSRILIRMDRTSDGLPYQKESLAIGTENFGAVYDQGVLIGGRSSDGSLEGPAQILYDFAIQPPGSYVVEMRFVMGQGQNENRAFWNEGLNSEFVSAVDVRQLPSWEVQVVPVASGNEWIQLATVAWGGGTVTAGDITDTRLLMHEGFAEFGFDAVHQNVAQFDFDRSSARGQFGVTVPSPVIAINALQRQILDLKGQDDSGNFNWYARVFPPPGGGWVKQTKSLRTVDTVTFTVASHGDYGDFNGQTGLQDCLSYIQVVADVLPRRIRIVLKNRNPSVTGTAITDFALSTPVTIPNKDIEIVNLLGASRSTYTSQPFKDVRGQARITTAVPVATTALSLTGRSSLTMENVTWEQPTFASALVNVAGPVKLFNTVMLGHSIGWDYPALTCHSDQTVIDQCHLAGCVNIGGGSAIAHFYGGTVRNTAFDRAVLRLRTSILTSVLTTAEILQGTAQGLTFEDCYFIGRTLTGGNTPHLTGMIDARGATHLTFRGCKVRHSSDEDGIRLGNLLSGIDGFTTNSAHITIEDACEFSLVSDNTHAFHAGVNGALGTGNHIFCQHDALSDSYSQVSGIRIVGNHFNGAGALVGSSDASAINLLSPRYVTIERNRFANWRDPTAGGSIMVLIWNEDPSIIPFDVSIDNNFFGDWQEDMRDLSCVAVTSTNKLNIRGNTFSRYPRPGYGAVVAPLTGVAVTLLDVLEFSVSDNNFAGWLDLSTPLTGGHALNLLGSIQRGQVMSNKFMDCSGENIWGLVGSTIYNTQFHDNLFSPPLLLESLFGAAIDLSASAGNHNSFNNNRWDYIGGTGGTNNKRAIHVGSGLTFTVMGNNFTRGICAHGTLGGTPAVSAPGYGSATLNYFQTYT